MAIYGQMTSKVSGDDTQATPTDNEDRDSSDFDVNLGKLNESIEDVLKERFDSKDKPKEEPHFTLSTSHTRRDNE